MPMLREMPSVGNTLKINIHKNKGGGFYIGKVLHTSTLMDERSFAMVRLSRMYQNEKIQPVDLERKTMQIPLYITEVWEFV
jgi:hypothetical protein